MSTNASLQLVEQKAQLHADDEARHAQEYVTPQLKKLVNANTHIHHFSIHFSDETWPVRKENEVALQQAQMRMVG